MFGLGYCYTLTWVRFNGRRVSSRIVHYDVLNTIIVNFLHGLFAQLLVRLNFSFLEFFFTGFEILPFLHRGCYHGLQRSMILSLITIFWLFLLFKAMWRWLCRMSLGDILGDFLRVFILSGCFFFQKFEHFLSKLLILRVLIRAFILSALSLIQ